MTMAKTKSIHWRLVLDLSMIPPLGAWSGYPESIWLRSPSELPLTKGGGEVGKLLRDAGEGRLAEEADQLAISVDLQATSYASGWATPCDPIERSDVHAKARAVRPAIVLISPAGRLAKAHHQKKGHQSRWPSRFGCRLRKAINSPCRPCRPYRLEAWQEPLASVSPPP